MKPTRSAGVRRPGYRRPEEWWSRQNEKADAALAQQAVFVVAKGRAIAVMLVTGNAVLACNVGFAHWDRAGHRRHPKHRWSAGQHVAEQGKHCCPGQYSPQHAPLRCGDTALRHADDNNSAQSPAPP
jgi:hypothetical protein